MRQLLSQSQEGTALPAAQRGWRFFGWSGLRFGCIFLTALALHAAWPDLSFGQPAWLKTPPVDMTSELPDRVSPAEKAETSIESRLKEEIGAPSPASVSPVPAAVASPGSRHDLSELYELELQLAERSFLAEESDENRDSLIMAYEKLIAAVCMPQLLKTLTYPGNPEEMRCLEYLEKIESLDPYNALSACVRHGTESPPCRAAFDAQEVRALSFGASFGVSPKVEMELKVHQARSNDLIKKLSSEFNRSVQAWRTKPSDENLEAVEKLLRQILPIVCKIQRLKFELASLQPTPKPPEDPLAAAVAALHSRSTPKGKDSGSSANRSIDFDIFSSKTKMPGHEKAALERLKRVRLLPAMCLDYIKQALKISPLSPEPVCYRDGAVAPSCLNALKDARRRKALRKGRKTEDSSGQPKDGIAAF